MSQAAQVHAQVPRGVLVGAAALLVFSLAAVAIGRDFGVGEVHMPSERAYRTLSLTFNDEPDGAVSVRNAETGAVIRRVAPGTGGFLRSALRGFAQERMRDGYGAGRPFTLTRWRDGALSLQDGATGRRIDLDAFGATQAEAFAQLFVDREVVK